MNKWRTEGLKIAAMTKMSNRARSRLQWPDDLADRLIILRIEDKKTYGEIATILGKTRNSIAGKCHRLGI